MQYNFLRLMLNSVERPPLLELSGALPAPVDRTTFLIQCFRNRIDFRHRQKDFVYIPIGSVSESNRTIIVGRIGREVETSENEPPETGFKETTRPSWRASNVAIDTSDHPDGQKLAFQYRQDVGKPISIASSLIQEIRKNSIDSGWGISVNPLFEKESFWATVQEYKGRTTAAIFSYNAPNVLRMRSQLNEDLKKARKQHNIDRYKESLENDLGDLILEGDDVEEAVNYASEGGGSIRLKSGRKVVYDSEKNHKSDFVEHDEAFTEDNEPLWRRIIKTLFK